MPKRGGKQGGGRGRGGRGGQFKQRGGGRGGGGSRGGGGRRGYDIDFYDGEDDFISLSGGGIHYPRTSTEDEVYRRIQTAKASRGGSSGFRGNRAGGFRPPPPKQNGNGKNSKHFFWPPPDYNQLNNNSSNGESSSTRQHGKARRNGPVQIMFNKATHITEPSLQDSMDEDNLDEDDLDEDDSSDDLIDRGMDSDDESDEEYLMQQFNWIEEDQDQARDTANAEREVPSQQSSIVVDHASTTAKSITFSTLNMAMTQSEDFLHTVEAEGDMEVDADEITGMFRPLSSLNITSTRSTTVEVTKTNSSEIISKSELMLDSNALIQMHSEIHASMSSNNAESRDESGDAPVEEPLLWVMDTTPDIIAATRETVKTIPLNEESSEIILPAKPKKKAHRSKRGGRNQREKQMNKQLVVGHDDDGLIYLENPSDDEDDDALALEDYLQNTMDPENEDHFDSLLGALNGLHAGGHGHSKDVGGLDPDDSDYEQQASEDDSQDEDDYDFEQDYEDGIKKLDFRHVAASMNDKRKGRKVDDLLRDELEDLLPLWQSGALEEGGNRRFKQRAKGYDIYDSDDEFMAGSSTGGKKRKKNKREPHGGSFESLFEINRTIEDFVKDRSNDSLQLAPMPKALRRKIHLLCNHYNLKSQSVGSGKRRFPILIKTDRTKMPANPVNLNKLLNQSEKELTKLSAQFQASRKGGNKGGNKSGNSSFNGDKKGKGRGFGGGNGGGSMSAPHGTVVGGTASAISTENLGHRMLSKMGWSPGIGLGATGDGITQPIEAIMRAKHRGLGHE
ncbi:hypothetical protein BGZ51_006798 [Haplosporangium sp. Z 767]|nr:hypothetical protein BGZ51_006798 [Haplosporangium sp. Z 767]